MLLDVATLMEPSWKGEAERTLPINAGKLTGVSKCHLTQQDTHAAALGCLDLILFPVFSCSDVTLGTGSLLVHLPKVAS